MATGKGIIDIILKYEDSLSSVDADNTVRRGRIRQAAQETVEDVWNASDFPFKYVFSSGTIAIDSDGIGGLPTDFADTGMQGGVYLVSNGRALIEVPPQVVHSMKESTNRSGSMYVYAIFGATAGIKLLIVPPQLANTTLHIWYQTLPPTILDADDVTVMDVTTYSGTERIPSQYHNTVLIPGIRARLKKSKGDSRDFQSEYKRGLAYMIARERPRRSSVQRLPYALGGAW